MSEREPKRAFAARPRDPEAWIKSPEPGAPSAAKPEGYTARLTIDITPELRGRIKVTAFRRGLTVAETLRALLEREFPEDATESGGGEP